MLQVGFETTISVFERAETAHAIDRAATVIDRKKDEVYKSKELICYHSAACALPSFRKNYLAAPQREMKTS
jgi:hypothetical protein